MKNKKFIMLLISIICFFIVLQSGCKPNLPQIKDYPDNYPCYMADLCLTINAYMTENKTDCTIALQKCYRYSDYNRCNKLDVKDKKQCWDDLGVRH